ncbi:Tol-Pal system beta propeller repeat protein TolB [Marinobacter orientalis]|uniref:Tol-Pal system protein TolB n=1 Tax=Marinobacter orientalis TaxID=1928859 RepID=A0A7Y0RCS5_9GAMM|nr:Tol-Pal system beta propeller repeat protein TolB [Marinobacter orientalis]NMT63855.1 Tol-Pal system protein TolB [Marinobacter orientalis]TGX50097.1 Tol-Pal system protein TolB [Marinobacter orientalis]
MAWLLMIAVMVAGTPASAELLIRITEGADSAIPVAVVPFSESGNLPSGDKVSSIVRDDLTMSGEFRPLPPEKMLSLPSEGAEVYFRDWRLLGQRYVLVGQLERKGDRIEARYELFDVNREQRIMGATASSSINSARSLAHHISDKVYEAITGVPGAFSTKLAYITLQRSGGQSVYRLQVSDVDGKRARVRLESDEPILSPAWSPDGRKLAYVSFETGKPAIYIHELASGDRTRIADFPGLNSAPAFSHDGRSLLMTLSKDGNAEIYKMDIQSGSLKRLTNHWSIDTEPVWDHTGEGFFFTSDRSGGPQIYHKTSENAAPRRITFGSRYNARPRPDNDGEYVYYVHQRDSSFHIARTNLQTEEETVLTRTGSDESPSVSPNGRMVIYATKKGGNSVLTVIAADGGAAYSLPSSEGEVRDPAWSPIVR